MAARACTQENLFLPVTSINEVLKCGKQIFLDAGFATDILVWRMDENTAAPKRLKSIQPLEHATMDHLHCRTIQKHRCYRWPRCCKQLQWFPYLHSEIYMTTA